MKSKTVEMSRKDYKGCNEDIKEALLAGYDILCLVSNFKNDDSPFTRTVTHYEEGQYRTLEEGGSWWNHAKPDFI